LKRGDRFYYENDISSISFTESSYLVLKEVIFYFCSFVHFIPKSGQLNEIRKSSISSLICNNLEINSIQPNAFLQPILSLK